MTLSDDCIARKTDHLWAGGIFKSDVAAAAGSSNFTTFGAKSTEFSRLPRTSHATGQ